MDSIALLMLLLVVATVLWSEAPPEARQLLAASMFEETSALE